MCIEARIRQIEGNIRTLRFLIDNNDAPIGSHNAIREAISVLNEEIPTRPIYLGDKDIYYCNECGDHVKRGTRYCQNCGQRQDWRDEDGR